MMKTSTLTTLLQELIYARGPCGQEDEVGVICKRELEKYTDKVWVDEAGNIIGQICTDSGEKEELSEASAIRVMTHMDEISMIVKRVDSDGSLRVRNLGGLLPGYFGQGPVDIMADSGVLPGVLSIGPIHTTTETKHVKETRVKPIDWTHVSIFTNKNADELMEAGVHAGTKVVISRERRKLFEMGDAIAGYFMDNRAAITISLAAASLLNNEKKRPPHDIYFVMTTEEELHGRGAAYASSKLPGDMTIAIEVGPIAEEYGTEFRDDPIVVYGDMIGLYTKSVSDRLVERARTLGMNPQRAVLENFGSDASIVKSCGHAARTGLISIPTHNTHGYEIIPRDGILKCAQLLASFLQAPV